MGASYLVGDVFDRLAGLEDGSVDLVMTSPPFLALRSYLPADHPDKAKEIGSEPDPAAFVETLLALTAEWRRVLAPHGSIAVELGDTYSGSGGGGGDYLPGGLREGQPVFGGSAHAQREGNAAHRRQKNQPDAEWPLPKSLALVPELYRVALAYGRNPLTGVESPAGRWRVRNVVRWHRPNPPVGALGDKYRPATSDLVVACVASDRWFDLDAVRTPGSSFDRHGETKGHLTAADNAPEVGSGWMDGKPLTHHPACAPPLDTWVIPTHPYKGSHYATYPPELCRVPVESMCPREVCRVCGQPRRRITGEPEYVQSRNGGTPATLDMREGEIVAEGVRNWSASGKAQGDGSVTRIAKTLGWSDCGHGDYRPGVVLDPFAGSGTTLAVATGHGRDAIGIDIDERNADLARERVGMFLDIDYGTEAA